MYRKFYSGLTKVENVIERIEEYLYILLLATLVIVVLIQVVGRYLIGLATPWADELGRYSYIWISWIVGAYTLKHGRHIVMNLIDGPIERSKNPKKLFFIVNKVSYTCVAVFMCVTLYLFWGYFERVRTGGRVTAATGWPMWIILLGVLIGMALMIIQSVYVLLAPYEEDLPEDKEVEQT